MQEYAKFENDWMKENLVSRQVTGRMTWMNIQMFQLKFR